MSPSTTAPTHRNPARTGAPLFVLVALAIVAAFAGGPALAQSSAPPMPDPNKCVIIVEDMGDVGFRISDAQVLAEAAATNMKKRLGQDAVFYEGVYSSAASMKKRLGPGSETQIQTNQITYYEACMKVAPYRIGIKFGANGKRKSVKHWVTATCKKVGAKTPLEDVRLEASTFADVRAQLEAKMPAFCTAAAPALTPGATSSKPVVSQVPGAPQGAEGDPAWLRKPKPASTTWQPPPLRE